MPLNSAELENIRQWIESRSPVLTCPGCGGKEWAVQNELAFASLISSQNGEINHTKGFPMVVVNCKRCGYSVLFNAVQIGIVPQSRAGEG